MEGSSAAGAAVTKATNKRKQPDRKREKTRAEKDAHKFRCVEYRKNKKVKQLISVHQNFLFFFGYLYL